MLMILSAVAAVLCLGIVAQLFFEDVEARRDIRRWAYRPRHALAGEDTIRIPVKQLQAALSERIEAGR